MSEGMCVCAAVPALTRFIMAVHRIWVRTTQVLLKLFVLIHPGVNIYTQSGSIAVYLLGITDVNGEKHYLFCSFCFS
jgi:hypothetical protein